MDIAQLGFRVDTGDVDKAAAKLDKLKAAANGVSLTTDKMAATVEGANARLLAAATTRAAADKAAADAALERVRQNKQSTQSDIAAARELQKKTALALKDAIAQQKNARAIRDATAAQQAQNAVTRMAFGRATSTQMGGTRPVGPAMVVNNGPQQPVMPPRDARPNKFNTANLAAQFQDIGVTASMGMSPMLIAMQQGTQLAAIMNSMEKPAAGLAAAFKQVFNATSILTIGVVGLVAAGLQFIDWITVAKGALNGLATIIEVTTPYIAGLGVALALIYSPAIISGIASIIASMYAMGAAALKTGMEMAAAWYAGLGPLGVLLVAIAGIGTALQLLGADVIGTLKGMGNQIIGIFVGAYNAVKETWSMLPKAMGGIVIGVVNIILGTVEKMINGSIEMINGLVDALPESLRPKGGLITWRANVKIDNPYAEDAAAAGSKAGKAFEEAFKQDFIGDGVKMAQELGNAAGKSIRDFASGLGKGGKDKKAGAEKKDPWEELNKGAERRIATLKAEQAAVGMSEEATARLKNETDLLNEAQQKNINLTPLQRARIGELAAEMASIEEQTRRTRSAYDFLKDSASGFFQDMKQGLQEGKGLWQSFGDAVTNIISKIFDAIVNSGIKNIMENSFSPSSGGGGILSTIGNFLFNAKGNAFGSGGVQAFAKGGSFTNSIVKHATPFAFAKGGALGVMGEAGPEAVMPLHRGPDGSLGVRMAGGAGGGDSNVIVNVNNYGDAKVTTQQRQTSNGFEIDVMIDEVVSQKVADQASSTNRSLSARENRALIRR